MQQVVEGSSARFRLEFRDYDGEPQAPSSVTYQILCLTAEKEIVAETPLTPVAWKMEFLVTAAQNALVNQTHPAELRRLVVRASYGAGDELVEKFDYTVVNIHGVE